MMYHSVSSQEMSGSLGITSGSLIKRLLTEAWGGSREATRKGFPVKPEAIILQELQLQSDVARNAARQGKSERGGNRCELAWAREVIHRNQFPGGTEKCENGGTGRQAENGQPIE